MLRFFALILLFAFACSSKEVIKETWISDPISEWPAFALTNEISFADTIYTDLANGFIVNTGADTIAVSCKHLFMVFEKQLGLETIDLGKNFKYWKMYPKNHKNLVVITKQLINTNAKEPVGQFNSLKVRDWIIFEIEQKNPEIYPLKIRYSPIKTNEIIYAVGWGSKHMNNASVTKLQCIKSLDEYIFTKTLTKNAQPQGTSGSPVIDKNGYLVGIVSGQEGTMDVIGNVNYLRELFDQYGIEYSTTYP